VGRQARWETFLLRWRGMFFSLLSGGDGVVPRSEAAGNSICPREVRPRLDTARAQMSLGMNSSISVTAWKNGGLDGT
jgi:hypothetical protein